MTLLNEDRVLNLDPVFGPMGIEAGRAIWESGILSMREKAVVFLASDITVNQLGLPFELHVGMARERAGLGPEEIREILRHVAPDAGYGIVAMAFQRLEQILTELGESTHSDSARTGTQSSAGVLREETLRTLRGLDADFAEYVSRQMNELWARPYLSRRERSLASLAVDVLSGTLTESFEMHLALAKESGISSEELRACMRILAEFSIPKAWEALTALSKLA